MKRKTLMMALFLAVTLALMCSAWADDDDDEVEYDCCCALICKWEAEIINPACDLAPGVSQTVHVETVYADCIDMQPNQESTCESEAYAKDRCEETRTEVWDIVNENKDEVCPEALMPLIGSTKLLPGDYECDFGPKDACSSAYLLGKDNPRLDIMKKFRDKVLSTSTAGRKLIALYYEYSHVLIEIFKEYPAIKAHAKEMLEKIIPGIEIFLNGEGKAGLLSKEISAEADILIEEIDSVMASPLKETLTKLREDVKDEGILE